jgi:Zn-dependent M28 family amino/carboxypeptidase
MTAMAKPFGWIFLVGMICLSACGNQVPQFDAQQSYQYILDQTDLGPRVPGTEAHGKAVTMFIEHFRNCGAEVFIDSSTFTDTIKNLTLPIRNVVARFYPDADKRIMLGAHYDSRPMCDRDPDPENRDKPVLGANDGASGVAVFMELANILAGHEPEIGVDLVLFDLEDWGRDGHLDYFCIGSKHYAQQIKVSTYEYVIVIDMIGDADQKIYKEQYSEQRSRPIVNKVWDLAEELGIETFQPQVGYAVYDDHLPFMFIGIPSIVVIDFDYPYWHTVQDTPDKCSPESLGNVGKILVALLFGG